jgi:ribosome biogenesis GTPase
MSGAMEPEVAPSRALVVRVDFGSCTLRTPDGQRLDAKVRGSLMGRRKALGNAVVVGDVVEFTTEGERTMVAGVAPRRNAFSRRASGERAEEQVVASNLDQVAVVASLRDPEFRPGFVDRVLAQAEHAGIPARLVLNKSDLGDAAEARALLSDYMRAAYAGLAVSARTGAEVDHLRQVCRGRRSLVVGHSGVGKSTLLNSLFPDLALQAGEVNRKTGKGRHTTTAAVLLEPEPGLELIDTPGMRSFGLWGIGPDDLDQSYPEFRPYLGECRFADCRHGHEPGCAIHAASDSGAIPARRWESYLKLRDELLAEASGEAPRPRGRERDA